MGIAGVLRTLPLSATKSYSENNTNITLDIVLQVETAENIQYQ